MLIYIYIYMCVFPHNNSAHKELTRYSHDSHWGTFLHRPEVRKLLLFYFYFFLTWSWKIIPYLLFYFFFFLTWSWKIIPNLLFYSFSNWSRKVFSFLQLLSHHDQSILGLNLSMRVVSQNSFDWAVGRPFVLQHTAHVFCLFLPWLRSRWHSIFEAAVEFENHWRLVFYGTKPVNWSPVCHINQQSSLSNCPSRIHEQVSWGCVTKDASLTHWGRNEMAAILQTTFSNKLTCMTFAGFFFPNFIWEWPA